MITVKTPVCQPKKKDRPAAVTSRISLMLPYFMSHSLQPL